LAALEARGADAADAEPSAAVLESMDRLKAELDACPAAREVMQKALEAMKETFAAPPGCPSHADTIRACREALLASDEAVEYAHQMYETLTRADVRRGASSDAEGGVGRREARKESRRLHEVPAAQHQ
jgi:hypothetical protein